MLTKNLAISVFTAAAILMASSSALAVQYITGHVTLLEATYMPDKITLQMDAGNTACPAGKWLTWSGKSAESVYATLLSALLSNKRLNFVISDNDTSCTGQFIHIIR